MLRVIMLSVVMLNVIGATEPIFLVSCNVTQGSYGECPCPCRFCVAVLTFFFDNVNAALGELELTL